MTNQQVVEISARADVYRLLSACFYQPEPALLEENLFGQLGEALSTCAPELAPLAGKMGDAFAAEPLDDLLLDYTRLFLGPYDILARPYGSCYLEGDKVVMGDSTINALQCYRAGGFEPDADFREMPDYIAVELEFLYLLAFRSAQAQADEDPALKAEMRDISRTFLRNHLGRWVVDFSARITKGAQSAFYPLLAELLSSFVKQQEAGALKS